jgi:5-methylcytosine-specific restriction endonuclease McrA
MDDEPLQLSLDEDDSVGNFTAPLDSAERRELEREEADWWIARMRRQLGAITGYESRQPCPDCAITLAAMVSSNGQNIVRCARCGRHLYNAPKTETGQRPRTVETLRRAIKPSQQARILDRDHRTCVLCGRSDVQLTIGHLLSVDDGVTVGAKEIELYDDANLAAMCEACNLGLSRHSVSPRTYAVIMLHLVRAEMRDPVVLPSTESSKG